MCLFVLCRCQSGLTETHYPPSKSAFRVMLDLLLAAQREFLVYSHLGLVIFLEQLFIELFAFLSCV